MHQIFLTVDTTTRFHGVTHFCTDGCPVFITFLLHQCCDAIFNRFDLCGDGFFIPAFKLCSALNRFFTSNAAKDYEFR
ncbi:Uncharacterised protein [Vibrio cholerae]|nr:Uncharacterised protein [Vibrio cholerae]